MIIDPNRPSFDKNTTPDTAGRWTAPRGSSGAREIPTAAWLLLLLLQGEATADEMLEVLSWDMGGEA